MTSARTAALELLATTGRAPSPLGAPSANDSRLAHEVIVLADLEQRLAQADAQGDARGAVRLAVLVAARRDRLAESQRTLIPEGEPEAFELALETLMVHHARGRL